MDAANRKLQMIIGESNGPPHDRVVSRLAKMIPKALARGEEIPEEVAEFIRQYDLGDALREAMGERRQSEPVAEPETPQGDG